MKKVIFILMLAFVVSAAQAQVKFETKSTDAVREMAIRENKLVFIDLYASWCPPCRMMERDVFSRRDVGEFMDKRFVAAKYDTDQPTGRELLKRYGSGAIPLYLVFDTAGELLGRIQGASGSEEFMENLRTIIERQKARQQ
ncbi:thioredoxin family protein [Alistipes sp.]|uniref:thioredoxin family protein n=1 Tax=Alistipes sp. TaxID=1872444 RepID=UPI003AF0E636